MKNQTGKFVHSFIVHFFNRAERLLIAVCFLLMISGCMIPEYQNPSGYSESYHRNMNALPLPEPVDRLSQKALYDSYNAGIPKKHIGLAANSQKNRSQIYASNKGLKADPSSNKADGISAEGIENSSQIETVNHERSSKIDHDELDETNEDKDYSDEAQDDREDSEELTRWQKIKRIFSR